MESVTAVGIPIVDNPVCEGLGSLKAFSCNLAKQSCRETSDASDVAGFRD